MKYLPTVDIWKLPRELMPYLQPGQWVDAGGAKGRFLGVKKKSGIVVVAWSGNVKGWKTREDQKDYIRTLRNYALGV